MPGIFLYRFCPLSGPLPPHEAVFVEPGEDAAEEVEIFNGGGVLGTEFLDQLGFVQFRGVQRVYADFPFQWLELQQFAVDGSIESEYV